MPEELGWRVMLEELGRRVMLEELGRRVMLEELGRRVLRAKQDWRALRARPGRRALPVNWVKLGRLDLQDRLNRTVQGRLLLASQVHLALHYQGGHYLHYSVRLVLQHWVLHYQGEH
jgi:hypothetical protein